MLLCSPSSISAHNLSRNRTRPSPINSMAVDRSSSRVATSAPKRRNGMSALEARISLVIALASQTSSLSQKRFVTDDEDNARESRLRAALKGDAEFRVKDGASIEVVQYNPPFTLPFTRRNEISLEVERKQE